jgi:hypothetical protein
VVEGLSESHPYRTKDGRPHLRDSWVLYLDALGTKDAAVGITDEDLYDIVDAEVGYRRFRHHYNLETVQQSLYFTDDIVVARPDDAGCAASLQSLFKLLLGVGVYVVGMAIAIGRPVRGGFARGRACIDTDPLTKDGAARLNVAHGEGLIKAVIIEQQRARVPRVVLSDQVLSHVETCLRGGDDPDLAFFVARPQLIRDIGDKEVFVDHLGWALSDTEPNLNLRTAGAPMPRREIVDRYRSFIVERLDHPTASAKYRWLAEYYDFTVAKYDLGVPIGVGNPTHFEVWAPTGG